MQPAPQLRAKTVFYDGVYTLGGRALRTVLALVLSILLARALGPYDRGLYALPTAVYTGIVLAVFTGLFSAVSYFMLNENAGRGILRPALLTGAAFCAVGAVPVSVMAIAGHQSWATLPAILLLAANVPSMILMGYAVGTKRIRWQSTYSAASTAGMLAFMAIVFLFVSRSAASAVFVYVFVTLLVGAACLLITVRDARTLPYADVPFGVFALFAIRAGLANLVAQLNYRGDLYVVALLTTPAVLGEYTVAVSAAETLLVVTQIPAVVLSPHIGSMNPADAARMTAACVRATLIVALAVSITFYAVLPLVVSLLYGGAFAPIVPVLRILLAAVLILSLATPVTNFFTLKLGRPEVALLSAGCAALACIGASVYLVPRIGMSGAAIATALAYLFGQSITLTLFLRATAIPAALLLLPTRDDLRAFGRLGQSIVRDYTGRPAA